MKTFIVEDEINVRKGFLKLINMFCPHLEVIGEAENIERSLPVLKDRDIDLLFLDINLPDGSGFDLLHQLPDRTFHTIFVTAYDQYAVNAFKIGAVDYLLKPVSPDLLIKAIDKVKYLLTTQPSVPSPDPTALDVMQTHLQGNFQPTEKIILKERDSMHIIPIQDIIYCSADGSYTRFHLTQNKTILTSMNLKEYEKILDNYDFIRSHHSYLINLSHVKELTKSEGGIIIMSDKASLPISTRKKSQVIEALKDKFLS